MGLDNAEKRKEQLKRAIRAIAKSRGYTTRTYWKVLNQEIMDWMIDNHVGTKWIAIIRIHNLRKTLPAMYLERER